MFVGHIQTRRVDAVLAIQLARQRDLRMRQANLMVDRVSDKKTPAQAAAWLGALIP